MRKGLIALSPLGVFIAFYLVTSIIAGDFYKIPITVAFMVSSVYAIVIFTGRPLKSRIDTYSHGAATEQMMLMIWIFVLAGAFAHSAKAMGSIDATVNLTLALLPPQMILAGMFLAACFVSISIGTSVGTIAALVPIAAGIANETGTSVAMMTAIIVGGSFFGDNLSFISDTTIMATQTQGCRLSDKFRVNAFIVFPAAILVLIVYLFMGTDISAPQQLVPGMDEGRALSHRTDDSHLWHERHGGTHPGYRADGYHRPAIRFVRHLRMVWQYGGRHPLDGRTNHRDHDGRRHA